MFVGIILSSTFYLVPSVPSTIEVVANLVYVVQAIVSIAFMILSFIQKPGAENEFVIEHIMERSSRALAGVVLLLVVSGMLVMDKIFSVESATITDYTTLLGFIIIQIYKRFQTPTTV